MQQKERLIVLIEKFQSNTCTAEELQELETWYATYDSNTTLGEILDKSEQQVLKNELFQAIRQETGIASLPRVKQARLLQMSSFRRVAAAVIGMLGLCYGGYKWAHTAFTSPEILYTTITTPRGQTREVLLPDSSKVWLNAASKIKYANNFTAQKREIFLEGEAFFDIKQDASRSFIVHTGEVATQVLGTSFNVSNYSGNETLEVTVVQGKVQVAKKGKEIGIVLPDQQVSYNYITGAVLHQKTDAAAYSSWKEGWLVFKEQSFQEIVSQLQRKFDTTIEIQDPALARCRFTASFAPGTDLPKVLNLLCRINHSNCQLLAGVNKIIIKGKGCN